MKKLIFSLSVFLFLAKMGISQDTFSIVAVDSASGQIGSAGASCIGNCVIIADIVQGRGAINTQSYYIAPNQTNARKRMLDDFSPAEIMTWLEANDYQNTPETRQYGAVDFAPNGSPRAASFSGTGCFDWKGHRIGPNYAIQGNILLGPAIVDSMEARFLATAGQSLAHRLMAAMQGANVPGADSRCIDDSISSLSAFLMVSKPDDDDNAPFLNLKINFTTKEPIDSLQKRFDKWLLTTSVDEESTDEKALSLIRVYPNPFEESFFFETERADLTLLVIEPTGRILYKTKVEKGQNHLERGLIKGSGLVIFQFVEPSLKTIYAEKMVLKN